MRGCIAALVLGCFSLAACETTGQMKAQTPNSPESADLVSNYDGETDSIDSLPDCTPELAGSFFWVRSDKAGYDCSTAGDWVVRPSSNVPGTEP
jgi:hypothetical protein